MKLLAALAVLCAISGNADGAKILVVFPMPSGSHYNLGSSLAKGLAERGHDVTLVSPFALKDPPKNGTFRDIVLTGMVQKMEEHRKELNFFELVSTTSFVSLVVMHLLMAQVTEESLSHERLQELITSGEKFDLVIVEQFLIEAHKALAPLFGAPLALLCPMGPPNWVNEYVGNPSPLSYIPEFMIAPEGPEMTFLEKVKNTALYWFSNILTHLYLHPRHRELVQKYIPNPPDLEEVQYNVSIALVNGHSSLNPAVPVVPSIVYVGGYHVKPPKKLPKDLQEFLDDSPEGVVYFSLGSNLRSTELPVAKREALLKTFAKLEQKVLWKWEDDTLPGQPANVKLSKWFPQQDILAHPNVKLFITHGGFLSTTETIYHGVPILAIPVFADQQTNAKAAVLEGYGLSVAYAEISEERLSESINELLSNPKYANSAKAKSKLFHDRPMKPMDTAVYWLEYVIRNGGAPHLRVAGLDLPWFQYYLVDVAALFVAAGLVLTYVNYVIFRAALRAICRRLHRSKSRNVQKQKAEKRKKQ